MKTKATAKYVGTSSRKLGLVAALIRGKSAADAARILDQTNKRATGPIAKVLNSAVSNATNNAGAKKGSLVVESVLIGPAPTLKRFRPRARGSASSIHKRTSHITIIVSDNAKNSDIDTKNQKKGATTSPAVTKTAKSEREE